MIVLKLCGGLGNQMFQYAFARMVSIKKHQKLYIDCKFYKSKNNFVTQRNIEIFNFPIKATALNDARFYIIFLYLVIILKKKFITLFNLNNRLNTFYLTDFDTDFFNFDKKLSSNNIIIDGYWQSEIYFNKITKYLINEYNFTFNVVSDKIAFDIQANQSVSLHVRRGDYITNSITNLTHGSCTIDYYMNALSFISNKILNFKLYIFSDDIDWVVNNFNLRNYNFLIVSGLNYSSINEMQLMSICKHNIIANSSFSWWAAWLNQNEEKIVISPKKWFANEELNKNRHFITPENWVQL